VLIVLDFVTLSCPSCGGKLELSQEIDRFVCAHCGTEHIVRRAGGIIALKPVVDEIGKVRVGVDKTASELAIIRLKGEIAQLNQALQELQHNFSQEQKQFQQTRNELETISCSMILIGSMLFLVVLGMVGAAISITVENSGSTFDVDRYSPIASVIFLVVLIVVLVKNPKRWLNRKRLEQLHAKIKAREDEYIRAKSEAEELLVKKQNEFRHHEHTVANT
jgi:ribosomal protein S27AE